MNTREWDIDYRRYVIGLRTMLAHPSGKKPWCQIPQVLDEIIEVYPDVWSYAEKIDQGRRRSRFSMMVSSNARPLKERCPLRLYRLLVALGRQELSEHAAKQLIAQCN